MIELFEILMVVFCVLLMVCSHMATTRPWARGTWYGLWWLTVIFWALAIVGYISR